MLVLVDDREIVCVGYARSFDNEGVSSTGLRPDDFRDWIATISDLDIASVEAFLVGECDHRRDYPSYIRDRSRSPIIAINERHSLEQTLDLFNAGFDDVVRKPIHVRELMARVDAIRRRALAQKDDIRLGDIRVFLDGRDAEVRGEPLSLPRRERRILEYLVVNRGRWVSKTQIFNTVYGIYDERVEETVVESHISKLRKKLRDKLGYDLIESKRFLGYFLHDKQIEPAAPSTVREQSDDWFATAETGRQISHASLDNLAA